MFIFPCFPLSLCSVSMSVSFISHKPFYCPLPPAQLYNLQLHISSFHCREKPHSCTHQGCPATFATKVSSLTTKQLALVPPIVVFLCCMCVGPAYCMLVCFFHVHYTMSMQCMQSSCTGGQVQVHVHVICL